MKSRLTKGGPMPTTVKIDPITRIEGHMAVELTVDTVNGVQQVVDARSSGTMFRGFETLLIGRDPRDATPYTQRICGVCPIGHGMASAMALEDACGIKPPHNGRILRNLVLGTDFLHSHILHFYHLAALDYINTTGILDKPPWSPGYTAADMIDGATARTLVEHYITALAMRRKAHQMGAIFGGRMPCAASFVVGGATDVVTNDKISAFRSLLAEVRVFVESALVPDARTLGTLFPAYFQIGTGCGNLLACGGFDLDNSGSARLLPSGRYTNGELHSFAESDITESVKHSWYTPDCGTLNPASGNTAPDADKPGAYSWIKSPRYQNIVHELGPLARMWISGRYRRGISVMDRLIARTLETKQVADAMDVWLSQLIPGETACVQKPVPASAGGVGLTEAPRGALGHWIRIEDRKIARYQVITPTAWNASPRDDANQPGPIEQALIGTPIADTSRPIEALRVIHSFDPCLACSVHLVRPKQGATQAGLRAVAL
ncbi:MAG TPA: nickel-dependent hydrogenase large subunit [Phycisphaerae bacterium]|nr:nickel-dependent hydrogenase large subunit [Phycisphaerae bacterium]HRR86313.1 nickel-dependent hydrogenase large subunit [Phycisphaerae bacterium]